MAGWAASSGNGRARWSGCSVRRRRPGVGGDLGRVQRHPADQQPGAGRPPVRAVLRDGDPGIVHLDRVVPGVLGDAGQQPPQRRDPLGADRERDVRLAGGAGQRPGEVPGVGAHRHPPRSPGRGGQGGQRAAQQIRRGRPRVTGAVAQVGGQHDLGLGPRPPRAAGRPAGPGGYRPRRASCGRRPPRRRRPGRSSPARPSAPSPAARAASPASARSPPPARTPPPATGRA
jgi:hypothetical protein